MKMIIATLLTLSSLNVFAADVIISSCADSELSLNGVESMKKYANGSVKTFEVSMKEPAGAPLGIAITIDRGDELSDMESFCRYIFGLSSADVTGAKSKYDKATDTLKLVIAADQLDENGISTSKILTILVDKNAANEADLVKAVLK